MKSKYKNTIWLLPALFIIITFTIVPFFLQISDSFQVSEINNMNGYQKIFSDTNFINSITNTLFYLIVPIFTISLSITFAYIISQLSSKFFRKVSIDLIYLQYLFIGVAVSAMFAFLFQTNYGFINTIREANGLDPIEFISSTGFNTTLTTSLYLLISSLPFYTVVISYKFIKSIETLSDKFKMNNIEKDYYKFKILLSENKKVILSLFLLVSFQMLVSFPIGLFGNLDNMILNNGLTIVGYINYMINISNSVNASAASMILLLIIILYIGPIYFFNKWKIKERRFSWNY